MKPNNLSCSELERVAIIYIITCNKQTKSVLKAKRGCQLLVVAKNRKKRTCIEFPPTKNAISLTLTYKSRYLCAPSQQHTFSYDAKLLLFIYLYLLVYPKIFPLQPTSVQAKTSILTQNKIRGRYLKEIVGSRYEEQTCKMQFVISFYKLANKVRVLFLVQIAVFLSD